MAPQNPAPGLQLTGQKVTEREAWSAPGVPVLAAGIALLLAGIALLLLGIALGGGVGPTALIVVGVLLLLAGELAVHGLTSVIAGEARAGQLFGRSRGTIRDPGLAGVNPFARRRRVSTRIRNQESAQAKVPDGPAVA